MLFFHLTSTAEDRFFDGEWNPFPDDLYKLHTQDGCHDHEQVIIRSGTTLGDLFFATSCVVSDRLRHLLARANATGFASFPTPVIRDGQRIATFNGLIVKGRGGDLDVGRSGAVYGKGGALFGLSSVVMDERGWDGSDVFFVPGLGITLFISERIAAIVRETALKNVKLIEAADYRF